LTLCPPTFARFFENSRTDLLNHVNDPFVIVEKTPAEHKNQFIYLDKYGPLSVRTAGRAATKLPSRNSANRNLKSNGLLPWQIRRLQREAY